jgi:hypothetical protein
MLEIVLSDITVMGQGYCVIGLKQLTPGSIQSVRPRPPWGFAWRDPFEFQRGESVSCQLTPLDAPKPHIEDHQSTGLSRTGRSLSEDDLIRFLNFAEVSSDRQGLFGCPLGSDTRAGNLWADPNEAKRSICGCQYTNIWFQVFEEPKRLTLRARLALPSNERLNSIPVVDREWKRFLPEIATRIKEAGRPYGAEQYLNRFVRRELMRSLNRFARIGLARPETQSGKCWLMLDSLFPQPQESWLTGL